MQLLRDLTADSSLPAFAKLDPAPKRTIERFAFDRVMPFKDKDSIVFTKHTKGNRADAIHFSSKSSGGIAFRYVLLITIAADIRTRNPLNGQASKPFGAGVGEGEGVALGNGTGESVGGGAGLLVGMSGLVAVGVIDSVPVMDNRLS